MVLPGETICLLGTKISLSKQNKTKQNKTKQDNDQIYRKVKQKLAKWVVCCKWVPNTHHEEHMLMRYGEGQLKKHTYVAFIGE